MCREGIRQKWLLYNINCKLVSSMKADITRKEEEIEKKEREIRIKDEDIANKDQQFQSALVRGNSREG